MFIYKVINLLKTTHFLLALQYYKDVCVIGQEW